MKGHHKSWLLAHPDRCAAWLEARLQDGFEVHHADGNRDNDAPDNLVLIEWRDHRRWHRRPEVRSYRPRKATVLFGAQIHPWRPLYSWLGLARKYGKTTQQVRTAHAAFLLAREKGYYPRITG